MAGFCIASFLKLQSGNNKQYHLVFYHYSYQPRTCPLQGMDMIVISRGRYAVIDRLKKRPQTRRFFSYAMKPDASKLSRAYFEIGHAKRKSYFY